MNDMEKFSEEFLKNLKRENVVLMLDFDGTLSPIVSTPEEAVLPGEIAETLKSLKELVPVVIISARGLSDLKSKINIPGLIYAGAYGFDMEIDGKESRYQLDKSFEDELNTARQKFMALVQKFEGAIFEEKRVGFSVHHRLVSPKELDNFFAEQEKVLKELESLKKLDFIPGKKVLDIMPKLNMDKGWFAKFILNYLKAEHPKISQPIYLGDDVADEKVFSAIGEGFTIRVGKDEKSCAKYFLDGQPHVNDFLKALLYNIN